MLIGPFITLSLGRYLPIECHILSKACRVQITKTSAWYKIGCDELAIGTAKCVDSKDYSEALKENLVDGRILFSLDIDKHPERRNFLRISA